MMLRAWQFCKQLWRSEDGPTAVEYAFLLALIVTVCIAAIQTVEQIPIRIISGSVNHSLVKSACLKIETSTARMQRRLMVFNA